MHHFIQHTSVGKEKIPALMVLSFSWKRQTTITKKYPDNRVCEKVKSVKVGKGKEIRL